MGELCIRIDEAVMAEASAELAEMGLTVERAVQGFLAGVARDKRLPFTPNAETIAAIEAAERGDVKRFDSIDALMADLHADD